MMSAHRRISWEEGFQLIVVMKSSFQCSVGGFQPGEDWLRGHRAVGSFEYFISGSALYAA
jgi:hypothetical protein